MAPDDDRSFLLAAAAWQDRLLAASRGLRTRVLLALLVAGVIAAALAAIRPLEGGLLAAALFALHLWCAVALGRLVEARSRDVDWWQRRLLQAERALADPARRHLTAFKLSQRQPADPALVAHGLAAPADAAQAEFDALLGKGPGHTRRVADHRLVAALHAAWAVLLAAAFAAPLRLLLDFAPR